MLAIQQARIARGVAVQGQLRQLEIVLLDGPLQPQAPRLQLTQALFQSRPGDGPRRLAQVGELRFQAAPLPFEPLGVVAGLDPELLALLLKLLLRLLPLA